MDQYNICYNSLMEEVNKPESWNKKRIIIAALLLVLLIAGGVFARNRLLPKEEEFQAGKLVEGASTVDENIQPDIQANIQEAVRERIDSIKQEVSGLNLLDIASSSPPVQKILNDIKALEQYPANQARELICKQVCGQ